MAAPRGILVALALTGVLGAACSSTSSAAPPTTSAGGSGTPGSAASPGATGTTAAGTSGVNGSAPPAGRVYPGAEWATADAATSGFDTTKLDAIVADAEASGSNCFVVTRHGEVVGEWYWNGTDEHSGQEVFSATKSYSSTLVGLAQEDGKLKITDKASDYIEAWKGTPSEDVTIRNLISNDSGRYQDGVSDYVTMAVQAQDKTQYSVDLEQQHPIGSTWVYNNAAIQTLDEVLQKALGRSPSDYATERLLAPIGMRDSVMKKDQSGNTLTFMGLTSTCLDMARYGYLFLNHGNWDGKQIVPEAWVKEATTPSQTLNGSYGYLWWLNAKAGGEGAGQAVGDTEAGRTDDRQQLAGGGPENAFFALGLGDQIIAVYPDEDIVVVRLAPVNVPKGAPSFGAAEINRVVTEALAR